MSAPGCDVMDSLSSSKFLISVLSFNVVVCLVAMPLLALTMRRLWTVNLFHFNTRLLVQLHLSALFLHCFFRIGLHITDLSVYFNPSLTGCEMLPTFQRCFFMRLPYNIGMFFSDLTSIIIVLERFIATIHRGSYHKGADCIGFNLVLLQCCLAAMAMTSLYWNTNFSSQPYYCISASASLPATAIVPNCLMIVGQIVAREFFRRLKNKNKKLRKVAVENLGTRYQLVENIRSIAMMQVFSDVDIFFVSANCLGAIGVNLLRTYVEFSAYFGLCELISCFPVYSVVLPIFLWYAEKKETQKVSQRFREKLKTSPSIYFTMLNQQLDRQPKSCISKPS